MKESKSKCETCSICGAVHEEKLLTEFEGKRLCPTCLNVETIICSHCGERFWRVDNQGTLSQPLRKECYDEHYTSCSECGRIIHLEDARYEDCGDEPLCYHCYESNRGHDYIEDYCYKPEPIFYGSGKRFFGVELEVDNGGECNGNAASVMHIGNANGLEHIYCKHDGSLEEGFENKSGDILAIDKFGNRTKSTFDTDNLGGFSFASYIWRTSVPRCEVTSKRPKSYQEEYIEQLKTEAEYCGYSPTLIDTLLADGFSTDDIEEMIYCSAY